MAKKIKSKKNSHSSLAQALRSTKSTTAAHSMKFMTAQQLTVVTLLWFVAHSVIIYFANQWYPSSVVLGTATITSMMAILYSMVVFTLLTVGAIPVIELVAAHMRWRLSNLHWFGLFWVIDAAALWFVARCAEQLGMGISSWVVAVVLGLLIDIAQGLLVKMATRN